MIVLQLSADEHCAEERFESVNVQTVSRPPWMVKPVTPAVAGPDTGVAAAVPVGVVGFV